MRQPKELNTKDSIPEKTEEQIYRSKRKAEKIVKGFEINYKTFENHVTAITHTDLLTFNLDTILCLPIQKVILTSEARATTTVKQSGRIYYIFF